MLKLQSKHFSIEEESDETDVDDQIGPKSKNTNNYVGIQIMEE